jgi:hypothetical protein
MGLCGAPASESPVGVHNENIEESVNGNFLCNAGPAENSSFERSVAKLSQMRADGQQINRVTMFWL